MFVSIRQCPIRWRNYILFHCYVTAFQREAGISGHFFRSIGIRKVTCLELFQHEPSSFLSLSLSQLTQSRIKKIPRWRSWNKPWVVDLVSLLKVMWMGTEKEGEGPRVNQEGKGPKANEEGIGDWDLQRYQLPSNRKPLMLNDQNFNFLLSLCRAGF